MVYFSDIFNVEEERLEEYGAFNISLLNDLPLFIDPFLLYASKKPEYQKLHCEIIQYLTFLRSKSIIGNLNSAKISRWYCFPEVNQLWLGYSESGNRGSGLGPKFGKAMSSAIVRFYKDLGNEKISDTSHLEKLGLFKSGIGRDNISDFTSNLIKKFLAEYTQEFSRKYLSPDKCRNVSVNKAYFNYELESWMPMTFTLPYFNGDYVLLVPKDILTKDDNWINFADMKHRVLDIANSIPNKDLRDRINDVYRRAIPNNPKEEDITRAVEAVVAQVPEMMDYYIKLKEGDKEGARKASNNIVKEADTFYIHNIAKLIGKLKTESEFYQCESMGSYVASRKRVMFLKDIIENKDGYRLFYYEGKPVPRETDLQLLFKFTWFATMFDANAEVNNGRGPVDFKISMGNADKTLVEFKLARNKKLKQNLKNQVAIYEAANNTQQSMKVIIYFSESEYNTVMRILKDLKLEQNRDIILINACNNKESASNVK